MKKNLFAILMLTAIVFSVSCTKDDVDDPTLQLSETGTITLPKAASEKAVTVTTNQTEWTAITNVDWIDLTQSGTTLTIKAGENATSVVRKAEVAVLAGGLARKLAIEQAESDLTIVTFPDKLEVNQWGGTFQFDVDANSDNWTVTSDAEWVKVTPKQFKKEVLIEVDENTTRAERTATLTISGGNASGKQFVVTQSGILYYILPFLKNNAVFGEIVEFEGARMSTYVPDFEAILYDEYSFITKSPVFKSIVYYGPKLSQVDMLASSNEFLTDPEFSTFMTDNGFEKKSDSKFSKIVTDEGERSVVEAQIIDSDPSGVRFTFVPLQPGPMPTFDQMPYGFSTFGVPEGSVEKVKAWEADNGGVYNEISSNPSEGFYWFDAPAPWFIRAYIFEAQPYLVQTFYMFTDIDKFFFEISGTYFLTEEFQALMNKEGFTDYLGASTSGLKFYGSANNPLELAIKVSRYTNVLEGAPIVELRFDKADNADGGSVWKKVTKDATLKKLPHTVMRVGK